MFQLDLQFFPVGQRLLMFLFKDFFFLFDDFKAGKLGLTQSDRLDLGGHLAIRVGLVLGYFPSKETAIWLDMDGELDF